MRLEKLGITLVRDTREVDQHRAVCSERVQHAFRKQMRDASKTVSAIIDVADENFRIGAVCGILRKIKNTKFDDDVANELRRLGHYFDFRFAAQWKKHYRLSTVL